MLTWGCAENGNEAHLAPLESVMVTCIPIYMCTFVLFYLLLLLYMFNSKCNCPLGDKLQVILVSHALFMIMGPTP